MTIWNAAGFVAALVVVASAKIPTPDLLAADTKRSSATKSCAAGSRCCRKWKKDRIAAKRTLRVRAEFRRAVCECSRKALISVASNCSNIRADGATFSLRAAN